MTREDSVIAELAVHCMGEDKQTKYIVQVRDILEKYQLSPQVGAMSTTIEGPMGKILEGVAECRDRLHQQGVNKLEIILSISSRSNGPISIKNRMQQL